MRWKYVAGGLALMFAAAYLDNIRGPVLPVLSRALSLPYGLSSWFFAAGNLASVFCTFLMIFLSQRLGERRLALGVCGLGLLSLIAVTQVSDLVTLITVAALLGSTIATMGALSNLLVLKGSDPHWRARAFSGLHMMYGVGSLAGPALAGRLLSNGKPWYLSFVLSAPWVVGLSGYFSRHLDRGVTTPSAPVAWSVPQGRQWLLLWVFCAYVAGEVLISTWMVAYLVECRHLSIELASYYLVGFFVMMGLTRALCFFSLRPGIERWVLWGSMLAAGFFFVVGHQGAAVALSFAGVFGPFFPLLMAKISKSFPAQADVLTLWTLASVQLTLALCQFGLGKAADRLGMEVAYCLPFFFLVLSLVGLWCFERWEREMTIA